MDDHLIGQVSFQDAISLSVFKLSNWPRNRTLGIADL